MMRWLLLAATTASVASFTAARAEENNYGISPYGAQAYPYNPDAGRQAAPTAQPGAISPYGAQAYPYNPARAAAPTPAAPAPISPYGSQAYPAQTRDPNDPISPYGSQAYPYRPAAARAPQADAPPPGQPDQRLAQGPSVPQVRGAYSLESQGAWRRVEGMPASMGNPTQLAPGTYAAPPVPSGTVFKNSGIPPLTRPKSAVHPPANRYSDLYGMYPQNVVGTWLLNTGGQWGMSLQGPDRNGMQEYTYGGQTGAGVLNVNANGTWTLKFAGKTQTGRWADAPDTVHFFGLDGEEQFAYWNNKGQLLLQGESGKLKTSVNGKP